MCLFGCAEWSDRDRERERVSECKQTIPIKCILKIVPVDRNANQRVWVRRLHRWYAATMRFK